ncbi:hypothetical protein E1267_28815 [Nonomuraea longispora]|uniref:Uncharacterized protein n=1 Tax=Nonomuraea longispora TaxID=1848320 RepID=A0A4R4N6F3_9ACTN|nr:hypothetical protein E1267_28815 [Nonomuraea longispora]
MSEELRRFRTARHHARREPGERHRRVTLLGEPSVRAAMIHQHSTAEADRRIADAMNVKIQQS